MTISSNISPAQPDPLVPPVSSTRLRDLRATRATRIVRDPRDLISLSEGAKLLGVSRPTVYRLIARGDIQSLTISRNRYLVRSEVERVRSTRGQRDG